MKNKILSGTIALFFLIQSNAQYDNVSNFEKEFDKVKNKYSLKYDVLSEIIQIGLNRGILTGKENDVRFKSTLYGLMVLSNKKYELDKNYSKLTFQRNFEIGGSMQISEDENINGFGLALKYAIINKRDLSVRTDTKILDDEVFALQQNLGSNLGTVLQKFLQDDNTTPEDSTRLRKYLNDNSTIKDFNKFYTGLKSIVGFSTNKILGAKMAAMQQSFESINRKYDSLTKIIEKRPLLTFAAEGKNADNKWDFASFKLEYMKGLGFVNNDENPWDIYLAASLNYENDTLSLSKKLNRSFSTFRGGINHVLIKKANNQSFVEVLGGFEYNSVFNGKYTGEKTGLLNALFNISFRIAPNFYLPLEIKYDPDKGKFMGQVRIKWDMIREEN